MLKNIFHKIHKKIVFENFIDSLLVFTFLAITSFIVFAFINLFFHHSEKLFLLFILSSLIFSFKTFFSFLFNERKSIERYNLLNKNLKNIPLTIYENIEKNNNYIEILMKDFTEETIKKTIFHDQKRRDTILRKNFSILSVLLILTIIFPLIFTNAFNLTEKIVVLKNCSDKVKIFSFNYGSIIGKLLVTNGSEFFPYIDDMDYPYGFKVFFVGPKVRSNNLYLKLLKGLKIDSISSLVKPLKYTGMKNYKISGNIFALPEFSDVDVKIFFNDQTHQEIFFKNLSSDSVYKITKGKYSDSLKMNIVKDNAPQILILMDKKEISAKKDLTIPVAFKDDYGIDSLYLILKKNDDSLTHGYKFYGPDTILIFSLDMESLTDYEQLYFKGKDNNPERRQISFSERLYLQENFLLSSIYDSTYVRNEFLKDVDRFSENVYDILTREDDSNLEKKIEEYKERLNELKENLENVKNEIKDLSKYKMSDKIYKEMFEVKKEIEKLDKNLLSKLDSILNSSKKIENDFDRKEILEKIKNQDGLIQKNLEELKKMIKDLNTLFLLNQMKEEIEQLLKKQDSIISNKNTKDQKKITESLEKMKEKSLKDLQLNEFEKPIDETYQLSKESEKDPSKREKVKEKLENLKNDFEKRIEQMEGDKKRYDKYLVIYSILFINEIVDSTQDGELINDLYMSIIDYVDENPTSPLTILLKTAQRMALMSKGDFTSLKKHNLAIILYLLKENPSGESTGSMEDISEKLSKISEEQMKISQTLWEMFNKSEISKDMLDLLSDLERKLSQKMKEIGEKSGDDIGEKISSLADSLKDLSEELKKGNLDEEILKKQERVLKRMLNLTKSIYKKGIEEKRESKTGKDYNLPFKLITPEDFGYKKYLELKKKYKNIYDFKRKEWIPLLKLYYRELIDER